MPFTSIKRECARHCDEYKCSYCPREIFYNSCSLIKHLRKSLRHKSSFIHIHETFDCTICNDTFSSKPSYIQHLQQKRIHKYDLHQAACCGRYQDVSGLSHSEYANVAGTSHKVKSDAQLNYQLGSTPMHCAAFKGYSRCLRIMLAWQDGDPNVVDQYGQTPVHIAARCGRVSSLKLLLRKGGKLHVRDKDDKTPIHLAIGHCMDAILEYQIGCLILKYYKPEITVKRSLSLEEDENVEEHGDVSESEILCTARAVSNNTVHRSLSFQQGDNDDIEEELSERELCVATEDTKTGEVALCSRAFIQEEIGNEQQDVGNIAPMLEDGSPGSITEVSSELFPYEVIARGKKAVQAFKTALSEGTAPTSRLKLIVVGEVGAGKTSLTRSLSQQPFIETREKTHGIQTSTVCENLVENTELDVSWKLADPGESHLDEILAKVVSESLAEVPESNRTCSTEYPLPLEDSEANQLAPGLCTPSDQSVDPGIQARVLVTHPSISVEGTPRKLPATRIAKKLLRKKKEGFDFKVSIWDFAGHQLYETMHHVFMNSRSLYLVVFNLLKMKKSQVKCLAKIHYWLNSISSHTSRSTFVILVGTHKAAVDSDFQEKAGQLIEQHFGNAFGPRLIRNCDDKILFAVENVHGQDDEGVSSLIKVIKSEASSSLQFVTDEFPLKWLQCEEEIIKYQQVASNKKFMKFNELRELLEHKCNVTFAEEEFCSMLAFFHDSGLILLPDTMSEGETNPCLKEIVVLSPQYLVDVMTRLHDIPKDRHLKRQFSEEFKKLKNDGRANCHLLEHLWKDLDRNDLLIELLTHFNLLYPLHNEIDDALKQENPPVGSSSPVPNVSTREFIIPCMLKEKSCESIKNRWNDICNGRDDLSEQEHELVFDFGRFLPPALFDYLVVHIYRHSHKSKGMQPILKRRNAIFSFSDKFLFRMELVLKYSQIKIYVRCKNGEHFLHLARKLREKVYQICQTYFKFLKFICGPPCPRSECPGADFDAEVVQRPYETSSSESQDSSDDDELSKNVEKKESGTCGTGNQIDRRTHVIPVIPNSFDPPYWCQQFRISEDNLKDWNPATVEDLCQSSEESEVDCSQENPTEDCCLSFVAECLGNDWKEVARTLSIEESEIENIAADHSQQKEQCFQCLKSWRKRLGTDAYVGILKQALQTNKRKDISDKLDQHYQEKHK